jgi:outer membrane protein
MFVTGKLQGGLMRRVVWAAAGLLFFAAAGPAAAEQKVYTLEDLYVVAIANSERIMISQENVRIAEANKGKAVSALLPRLTGFGGYTRYNESKITPQTVIQPSDYSSWGARLDQSMYLNGREITGVQIAGQNIERTRYDYRAAQEDYLMSSQFGAQSVTLAFYEVLRARKGVEIADSNVERLTKYRDAAVTRLKVGEVTKTTLLRAEGELSGALSEQIKSRNLYEMARAQLVRVAGIAPDFELREVPPQDPGDIKLADLKKQALDTRSEMKSLELQKEIAEKNVTYVKGLYWPSLAISAVYTAADQNPASPTFNQESMFGGVTLTYPFFEGGLRRAEVSQARSQLRQAELLLKDTAKSVNVEVENAYLELITQRGIRKSLQDQLAFATDNFNAITRQFDFGLASSLDVIDANNLLVTSQQQMANADYGYQLAIYKLKRATGLILADVKK